MKRMISVLLFALCSLGVLSACNTMEGLGKDVQKLGDRVEEKAKN